MTTPTNWPNPERPGVPMFPERDGWHIVVIEEDRHEYWWDTEFSYWTTAPDGDLIWTIEEAAFEFSYEGPVLAPTQIDEMLTGERERAAKAAQRVSDKYYLECEKEMRGGDRENCTQRMLGAAECAKAIRNLGDVP